MRYVVVIMMVKIKTYFWRSSLHSSRQEKVSHAHEEHEANSVNMDNIASLRYIHIFMDSLTFYSIVVVNRSIINVLKEFTNISPTILQQF
jgi:hypothetical protein